METERVKKKAWYQVKIEELEAKVKALHEAAMIHTTSTLNAPEVAEIEPSINEAYANGYVDCMHKYGILSKLIRRRTHEMLKLQGPGAVKGTKRNRFAISVPSV